MNKNRLNLNKYLGNEKRNVKEAMYYRLFLIHFNHLECQGHIIFLQKMLYIDIDIINICERDWQRFRNIRTTWCPNSRGNGTTII